MNTAPSRPDDDVDEPPPITPEHIQHVLKTAEDAVHVDRYEQRATIRGRLELAVLDRLAAFVRRHYWQIRPIQSLTWDPVETMPDPKGEYDDDTCPVFAVTIEYDEVSADPSPAPSYLGGTTGQPGLYAMPVEPPGGTVRIRAGLWAGATLTRRRDGLWSHRTDQGVALWSWMEVLAAAGPDGVRLIDREDPSNP